MGKTGRDNELIDMKMKPIWLKEEDRVAQKERWRVNVYVRI